ncbi:Transketolase-like protein 2 [Aphelenchoides avenae]|nr:Transketolase-like protein 2 [Aphelenchus avenae]
MSSDLVALLEDASNRLRVSSIEQTAAAKSGHPTSSCSAAEIVSTLFFAEMRYDVSQPRHPAADRFVLSKGHACPVLYAAWEEAGLLTRQQVLTLRQLDSDIEGHPTPRLNFIDVATGSLGQGLSCAAGLAYMGKHIDKASYRVYCLLGDGETAEGAVWEAAAFASFYKLDNLVGIIDINRLGQSTPTQLQHDLSQYAHRFEAFGWHAISVDGHDINALLKAYAEAKTVKGKPTMILAKTLKGKGISGVEDLEGNHGKPVDVSKADEIRAKLRSATRHNWTIPKPVEDAPNVNLNVGSTKMSSPPEYKLGEKVATRAAYGTALVKLCDTNKRVISLDGDMKNSTFSEKVHKKYPEQFVECFIAEQNMVGVGVGLGCRARAIPFVSTFAAFLTRAADQIRMGAVSFANVKFAGSHCGVSIGEDGPSQMALEDLALFRAVPDGVVLYPSDAVACERATELAANRQGIVFIRTSRPATPVLRQSPNDKAVLVGAGVTLFECLKAQEQLASEGVSVAVVDIFSVKPIDHDLLAQQAQRVGGRVITVEDHYQAGGIGEAVASTLSELSNVRVRSLHIKELPRSGTPDALLDHYGISAKHVVKAVKEFQ